MAKKSKKEIRAEWEEENLNEQIIELTWEQPLPRKDKNSKKDSEDFEEVWPKAFNTKNHNLIRGTQVRIISWFYNWYVWVLVERKQETLVSYFTPAVLIITSYYVSIQDLAETVCILSNECEEINGSKE